MTLLLILNVLRCGLILLTAGSNGTLVWKILRRKHLYTLFNLSMCVYFSIVGVIFCLALNEYGNVLSEMINEPSAPSVTACHKLHICRMITMQAFKVFILNIVYRYVNDYTYSILWGPTVMLRCMLHVVISQARLGVYLRLVRSCFSTVYLTFNLKTK